MQPNHFNIRVYGIMINDDKVLVCDELIKGHSITKFTGGGLEFGEGTIDCLKREFIEETKHEIEVTEHFYTTDFYQVSAYNKAHQIMSIYYLVEALGDFQVKTTDKIFDFTKGEKYDQTFRWMELKKISGKDFTLPIDKVVGDLLKKKFESRH